MCPPYRDTSKIWNCFPNVCDANFKLYEIITTFLMNWIHDTWLLIRRRLAACIINRISPPISDNPYKTLWLLNHKTKQSVTSSNLNQVSFLRTLGWFDTRNQKSRLNPVKFEQMLNYGPKIMFCLLRLWLP